MIDPFGRSISYLRVSVTDRCDLRCVYCMAEEMTFLPRAEVLSLEELERLCGGVHPPGRAQAAHHRWRAPGPARRDDAVPLARRADLGHGLEELTLTTNGTQLAKLLARRCSTPACAG